MFRANCCFDGVYYLCFSLGSIAVIDEGHYNGLSSQLAFQCTKCGQKTTIITSNRYKRSHEVNVRASLAMAELGLGREAFATLCYMFGMPPPSLQSSWEKHNKNISSALECISEEQYVAARKKLRRCLQEDDDSINDNDTIDVVVSYDGTWHHRGFRSSHAVGVVMLVDTGKILDAAVISKSCEICEKSLLEKTSPEYEEWKKEHQEQGKCLCNHKGPSSSMETAAAKIIWSRSVTKHKMCYTQVLCDGDNKTVHALNEMQVYGSEITIDKLECVNHIHKRMGTGLRNLVKKSPHVKGGSGGLTAASIEHLSSYYRNHIMKHTTTSKNPDDIDKAVKKMQINILASLHHSVVNNDPLKQHKYCLDDSVEWCSYKKQLNDPQASSGKKKKKQETKKLPESFLPHMLPLYRRLSDEALLKRCVSALTQNQNESFNATIWRRCPKERYFGTAAVKCAVSMSVLTWNIGRQGIMSVFDELQLPINVFTKNAVVLKDKKRMTSSQHSSSVKKRKVEKVPVTGDYVPGGH